MTDQERNDPETWAAYLKNIRVTMAYGAGTGAGITGNTEFDVFIPEIWSSAVEGLEKTTIQDMITDYSSFLSNGETHTNTIW